MQKLKTVVQNIGDVDKSHRANYVEHDGKFVLDLEGIADLPEVAGLKSAIDRLAEEVGDKRQRLAELPPDDFSVEEWKRLKSVARDANPDSAKAIEDAKAEYDATVAAKDNEIARKQKFMDRKTIDVALRSNLEAAGVKPELMDAAIAVLVENAELNGTHVFIKTKYGVTPVARYVKNWCATGEGAPFVDPSRRVTPRFGTEPDIHAADRLSQPKFAEIVRALSIRDRKNG